MNTPEFIKFEEKHYLNWLDRIISDAETIRRNVEMSKFDLNFRNNIYPLINEHLTKLNRMIPMGSALILYKMMEMPCKGRDSAKYSNAIISRLRKLTEILERINNSVVEQNADALESIYVSPDFLN